jgi:hypothetical protein
MPLIPATQEADIRMITVQSQLGQIVYKTLILKIPITKQTDGVALHSVEGPEFEPQYH